MPTFPLPENRSTILSSESPDSLREPNGDYVSPGSTSLGISQSAIWYHPSSAAEFSHQSQITATPPGSPSRFIVGGRSLLSFSSPSEKSEPFPSSLSISSRQDRSRGLFPPLFAQEDSIRPNLDVEQACLLRYFIENLARWVRHLTHEN